MRGIRPDDVIACSCKLGERSVFRFNIEDAGEDDEDARFGLHFLWRNSESKFEVHQSDRRGGLRGHKPTST